MLIASSELQAASGLQETACTAAPPVIRYRAVILSVHGVRVHTLTYPRSRQEQGQLPLNTSSMRCPHEQMLTPIE